MIYLICIHFFAPRAFAGGFRFERISYLPQLMLLKSSSLLQIFFLFPFLMFIFFPQPPSANSPPPSGPKETGPFFPIYTSLNMVKWCDCAQEQEEEEEERACSSLHLPPDESQEPRKQSLLLRLFESKLFDPALAMNYLFITKEPGVLEYIGNRLFRQETKSMTPITWFLLF